jgi:CTP synthase
VIEKRLELTVLSPDLTKWNSLLSRIKKPTHTVHIAIAGKYAEMPDAYLSVIESCKHAGAYCDAKVCIHRFLAEEITSSEQIATFVKEQHIDGFIVPG